MRTVKKMGLQYVIAGQIELELGALEGIEAVAYPLEPVRDLIGGRTDIFEFGMTPGQNLAPPVCAIHMPDTSFIPSKLTPVVR